MEAYIAAVYPTKDAAVSAHAELQRLSPIAILRAGVYGRGRTGDVVLQDQETTAGFDFSALPGGEGREALDELNEKLPDGAYALVAHVDEQDPRVLDDFVAANGGRLYRKSLPDLRSEAMQRFTDAASM